MQGAFLALTAVKSHSETMGLVAQALQDEHLRAVGPNGNCVLGLRQKDAVRMLLGRTARGGFPVGSIGARRCRRRRVALFGQRNDGQARAGPHVNAGVARRRQRNPKLSLAPVHDQQIGQPPSVQS